MSDPKLGRDMITPVVDFLDRWWYGPLERLLDRASSFTFILIMPFWLLAFALPPLVIGLLFLVPEAMVVIGMLALVGVL